jgi:hypothetical protein
VHRRGDIYVAPTTATALTQRRGDAENCFLGSKATGRPLHRWGDIYVAPTTATALTQRRGDAENCFLGSKATAGLTRAVAGLGVFAHWRAAVRPVQPRLTARHLTQRRGELLFGFKGATYPTSSRLRRTSMSPLPRRCFIDEQTTMKPVDRRSASLEIAGLQHNRNAPGFYPLQHKSRRLESHQRRSGRVVDCGGFENRCGLRLTGGSNPSSSATISLSTVVAPSASAASRRAT